MNKPSQSKIALGYLLGANAEAVVLVLAAVYGAEWLNENYVMDFDWLNPLMGVCLVLIAVRWIMMFRALLRMEKQNQQEKIKEEGR